MNKELEWQLEFISEYVLEIVAAWVGFILYTSAATLSFFKIGSKLKWKITQWQNNIIELHTRFSGGIDSKLSNWRGELVDQELGNEI